LNRTILLTVALFSITLSTLAQSALPTASAPRTPYGVREDTIGETFQDYATHNGIKLDKKGRHRGYTGCQTESGILICKQSDEGDGIVIRTTSYSFINGTLDQILGRFYSNQYAMTRAAIIHKYGPPTRTSIESYTTVFGADVKGELASWNRPGSVILLTECDKRDQSTFMIFNPATVAVATAAKQAAANARF
jgi:hypothetical protein